MTDKLSRWQGVIPDEDLAAYRKGSFGRRIGLGARPALLNIDTTWMFVDPSYDMCGRAMPEFIAAVTRVTEVFRRLDLPIYYSRRDDRSHPAYRGIWNLKLGNATEFQYVADPKADQWPDAYGPRPEDRIVLKNKPSAFFATPLESFMRYDGVDSDVVIGVSTSGCDRAAVTDAFSHNFRVTVIEEAVGDRSPAAHTANLFDMDMKFADVEPIDAVLAELEARFGTRAAAE